MKNIENTQKNALIIKEQRSIKEYSHKIHGLFTAEKIKINNNPRLLSGTPIFNKNGESSFPETYM